MEPDDPRQLLAFLKAKARHMEGFAEGGSMLEGWIGAAVDVELWIESESIREAIAEHNAQTGLT